MAKILDGKRLANKILIELKLKRYELEKMGIVPGLAAVVVGNNSASRIYIDGKKRMCEEIGIRSYEYAMPEETTERELVDLVKSLNARSDVDGILIQLPLPKHLNESIIIESVSPKKDVDAFHPYNVGKIAIGESYFMPCTASGIMELISESGVPVTGKECVVVGRSNIVGRPVSNLLLKNNGTVTVCHSKTENLSSTTKRADILIVAIGRPEFITKDMVKQGAVVIDVGINRLENGQLVGDVDKEVQTVAGHISPVPGGVGPMTKVMLMKNTLIAACINKE